MGSRCRRIPGFSFKVTRQTPALERPHLRGLKAAWASVDARWKEMMGSRGWNGLFLHWMIGDAALQEFLLAIEDYYEACGWSWKPPRWATPYPWQPTTDEQRVAIRAQLSEPCVDGCGRSVLQLDLDRIALCMACYNVRQWRIDQQKERELANEWKAKQAAQAGGQVWADPSPEAAEGSH